MRTVILALLIALLPVRGWVSDAMATSMGLQQAVAQIKDAAVAAAAADTAAKSANAGDVEAECSGCASCQMCHAVALFTSPQPVKAVVQAQVLPQTPAIFFISADRAPGFKPPIV